MRKGGVQAQVSEDLFGSGGVPHGSHRLLCVHVGGVKACNHQGLAVSSQRVFEQAREFGVTVGNVLPCEINHGWD